MKEKYIIHRGSFSYKFPENSIPAFRECLKNNMHIELDLHILKDNVVVVFHDNNLKRMCKSDVNIKDLTLNDLLKYKLNNSNYRIPTFKEVLDLVNGSVTLDIELKYDVMDGRLEKEVINILRNYKGKYFLKSFNPIIVKRLKKLRKKYNMNFKVGLLIHNVKSLITFVIYSNPDFISFNYKFLNKNIFRVFSKFKPTIIYTIKSKEDFNSIKDYDGSYILENYMSVFK